MELLVHVVETKSNYGDGQFRGKTNHYDASSDQWKSMKTRCVYYFLLLRADYSPGFSG